MNMSKISIQDKIDDAKIKIDKALYLAGVFFIIEESEAKDGSYKTYVYMSAPNNVQKFGFIDFNEEKGKIQYIAEWIEMTKRNEVEGVENPETYIPLNNDKEFVEYFSGISLGKILENRKKSSKK
jgi:hypothetical protein